MVIIYFLASIKNGIAQVQELIVSNAVFLQRSGILRPAKSKERTHLIPCFLEKRLRGTIMPGGVQRVDLQGQKVQAYSFTCLSENHLSNGGNIDKHAQFEFHFKNRAPLS